MSSGTVAPPLPPPAPLNIDSIVAWNANLVFVTGLTLNATLLWLVLFHSSGELRAYSRVLYQTVAINTLYLFSTAFSGIVNVSGGAEGSVTYGVGWAMLSVDEGGNGSSPSAVARNWNFALLVLCDTSAYASMFSIVAPFLYRYMAICHGRVLSLRTYLCVLMVLLISSAYNVPIYVASGMNSAQPSVELLRAAGMIGGNETTTSTPKAIASVLLPTNTLHELVAPIYTVVFAILYVYVLGCSAAILRHIRRHVTATSASGQVRAHQTQINIVITVQALLPLVFEYLPSFVVSWIIGWRLITPTPQTPALVVAYMGWQPVVNALISILVVRPYRRVIIMGVTGFFAQLTSVGVNATVATNTLPVHVMVRSRGMEVPTRVLA